MNTQTPTIAVPPARTPDRTIYKLLVLLALAGAIVYSNAFTTPFYLDDTLWIKGNTAIDHLSDYVWAMKSRPLIAVTLHINHRLHGDNVFGYHVTNVLIHVLAACTLFGIVRRTLLLPRWQGRFDGSAHWLAFAVALLWIVHPLQTQAITYVIQRCESLMGLFFLLTLYCMIRSTQSPHPVGWYLASWASCMLGAGCKEVMVTILPIMICYDRMFVADWRTILRQRWWYYGGVIAIWALPFVIAVPFLLSREASSAGFGIPDMPPHYYLMTQPGVILYYLRLCLIPFPQYFLYRGWPVTTEFAQFWPTGLALGCLLLGTFWLMCRRNGIGFLGFWFFGILSITSIIPLLDIAFEHRLYLPLAGMCTLVVMGGYLLLTNMLKAPWSTIVGGALLVVTASTLGILTLRRNEDYRTSNSLWQTVFEAYPNSPEALVGFALGMENARKFPEALEYYEKCLKAEPGRFGAESRYGDLLCRLDRSDEGIKHLVISLQAMEAQPTFHHYRGDKYLEVGRAFWIRGDGKTAERLFRKAIDYNPERPMYHTALGLVLSDLKRDPESRAAYEQALVLDHEIAAHVQDQANQFLFRYIEASQWTNKIGLFYALQAAQVSDLKDPVMLDTLAEAYAVNGMFDKARATADAAAKATPAAQAAQRRAQLDRVIASYQQPKSPVKK